VPTRRTSNHPTTRRCLAVLGCLLLAVAACGDDDASSPQGASGDESAGPGNDSGGGGAGGENGDDGSDDAETLSDLLGIGGTPEELAERVRQEDRARQELVRDCMTDQGFEYVVHVAAGQVVSPTGLPTDLSDEDFRRQYGYGIATGFEAIFSGRGGPPPDEPEDPNIAIVAAMSESERGAYEQALHGSATTDGEVGGCEGEAEAATDRTALLMEQLGDDIQDLWARVGADARVVDAERAWADCMADAGYDYADEQAIRDDILRRLNPINDAAAGQDIEEGRMTYREGMELTDDQQAELADLRGYELAVANADQDCRVDLDEVRRDVQDEYEAAFVADHRDQLDDMFPDG
jgi:hypothetical protein